MHALDRVNLTGADMSDVVLVEALFDLRYLLIPILKVLISPM